jgi:uncharacterized protein
LTINSKRQHGVIMQLIRFEDLATVPWKNGAGITREVAAARLQNALVWRLSIADVTRDGPFSNFAGLTRILTVIEGNGMALVAPDEFLEARFGQPVIFDGGLPIQSKLLNGPIRDLNLMFDPHACRATVAPVEGPTHAIFPAGTRRTIVVIGMQGECQLNMKEHLHFGDVALFESGSVALDLTDNASALIVTLDMNN